MIIKVLSSQDYENSNLNLGDCIIIDNGTELVVYDCGCEQHAKRVVEYMAENGYLEVAVVLSHNDSDHFGGIDYLIENTKVSKLATVLLLKYKDELLERIDDNRKNRDSISKQILELYNNIATLSEKVELINIYDETGNTIDFIQGISVVGPDLDYMLGVAAKGLDTREGDTIDGESIINATSVQVEVSYNDGSVLLVGDSSFDAIEDKLLDNKIIQLPHHGKRISAEKIFDKMYGKNDVIYIVSDNTGDSNGGSNDLNSKGHIVKNTRTDGDIELTNNSFKYARKIRGSYSDGGVNSEIYTGY